MEFVEDGGLERRFRARLTDFRGSGYDRGHLVRPLACAALPPCCSSLHGSAALMLSGWDHAGASSELQGLAGRHVGHVCAVQHQPAGRQRLQSVSVERWLLLPVQESQIYVVASMACQGLLGALRALREAADAAVR